MRQQGQQLIDVAVVWYYAACFIVGFCGGLFRTTFNGNYRNWGHCVATGCMAGCVASAVVGFWTYLTPLTPTNSMFFLSVSMVIGLSGSEAVLIIPLLTHLLKSGLKRVFGDWEKKNDG